MLGGQIHKWDPPLFVPSRQEAVAQAAANGSATNGNHKRQLEGDEPSSGIKRQKSGSGTEALTKDGSAPLSTEEVCCFCVPLVCLEAQPSQFVGSSAACTSCVEAPEP